VISRTDPLSVSFRSEFSSDDSPIFPDLVFSKHQLSRREISSPVLLEFVSPGGKVVASSVTSFADLAKASKLERPIAVGFDPRGLAVFSPVRIAKRFSFLDYVQGGLEINLFIGVDFTRSNGDPFVQPGSLHSSNPDRPNDYVTAVKAVGEVLKHYDSDQKFPAYGFGAKLPPAHVHTSDCFALNGNIFDPEISGIGGVLDCYRTCLESVRLHGPTRLAPVLREARRWAEAARGRQYLFVMLVTDGDLSDLEATIDEIVQLSALPVSIVIVGVGAGDFSKLRILDADRIPLFSKKLGLGMSRDIVQFVPLDDFKNRNFRELAAAVLEEVPREVLHYFQVYGLSPGEGISGPPEFLAQGRARMQSELLGLGYEKFSVDRILEKGVPSDDLMHCIELLNSQSQKRENPAKLESRAPQGRESSLPICKICLDKPCDARLLPCTHEVACLQCSRDLGLLCPLCRATIEKVVPI